MGFPEKLAEGDNLPSTIGELGEQIVKSGQKAGEKLGQGISDVIDSIIDFLFDGEYGKGSFEICGQTVRWNSGRVRRRQAGEERNERCPSHRK